MRHGFAGDLGAVTGKYLYLDPAFAQGCQCGRSTVLGWILAGEPAYCQFDRQVRAALARITGGISLISLGLAGLDWALQTALAPGKITHALLDAGRHGLALISAPSSSWSARPTMRAHGGRLGATGWLRRRQPAVLPVIPDHTPSATPRAGTCSSAEHLGTQ